MFEHNQKLTTTVGEQPPITMVLFQRESAEVSSRDSGFSVLFSDAPEQWEGTPNQMEQLRNVCLHCLIEHHPEVGRALDLAKVHGSAERYPDALTGDWVGRDTETGKWFFDEEPS